MCGAALVAAFLLGWLGWTVRSATHPTPKSVTIIRVFDGAVEGIGNDGTSGCIRPSDASPVACGPFYVLGGRAVRVGQSVHAVLETIWSGANGEEVLLLYSPTQG